MFRAGEGMRGLGVKGLGFRGLAVQVCDCGFGVFGFRASGFVQAMRITMDRACLVSGFAEIALYVFCNVSPCRLLMNRSCYSSSTDSTGCAGLLHCSSLRTRLDVLTAVPMDVLDLSG